MALCKGTNYCVNCWTRLTDIEKEECKQPVCNKCMKKEYPAELSMCDVEPGFSEDLKVLEEISLIRKTD